MLRICQYKPPQQVRGASFGKKKNARRQHGPPAAVRLFLLLLAGLFVFIALIMHFNILPVLKTMSEHQASLAYTKLIHEVVAEELLNESVQYESLIRLSRSETGRVTAIETDVVSADRLKSSIASRITAALQNHASDSVGIPLGTLLDSPYFNGRGPAIPFKIVPSNAADVNFESSFTSTGINQTLHRISLAVTIDAQAIIPGIKTQVRVNTSFLIAETVVVGEIPSAYAEFHGKSLPGLAAGYGLSGVDALQ